MKTVITQWYVVPEMGFKLVKHTFNKETHTFEHVIYYMDWDSFFDYVE